MGHPALELPASAAERVESVLASTGCSISRIALDGQATAAGVLAAFSCRAGSGAGVAVRVRSVPQDRCAVVVVIEPEPSSSNRGFLAESKLVFRIMAALKSLRS